LLLWLLLLFRFFRFWSERTNSGTKIEGLRVPRLRNFRSLWPETDNFCFQEPTADWNRFFEAEQQQQQQPTASLEMAAASVPCSAAANINSCHVYTNPNYPHSSLDVCGASQQIEIGGLPFFLTSGGVAETSLTNFSRSPVHSPVHSQGQGHGKTTIQVSKS